MASAAVEVGRAAALLIAVACGVGVSQLSVGLLSPDGSFATSPSHSLQTKGDPPPIEWVQRNPYPTASGLSKAVVLDSSRVVVVGGTGVILRTSDGGETWTFQSEVGGGAALLDVVVAGGDVLFAVGRAGTIIRSDDAGETWVRQDPSEASGDLNSVDFINSDIGWVAGNSEVILHTRDGGKTWVRQRGALNLNRVAFVNESLGMATANASFANSVVMRTLDGGDHWDVVYRGGRSSWFSAVGAIDEMRWVVTESFGFHWTDDGGITWRTTPAPSGLFGGILDVHFVDADRGTVIGPAHVFLTEDGGQTWARVLELPFSPLPSLNGISYAKDAMAGMIIGYSNLLRTDDGGATWRDQIQGFTHWLYGAAITSPTTATIVGEGGFLARTTDGGKTWIRQETEADNYLFAVNFVDADTGMIVGNGRGTCFRTTNGGETWLPQEITTGTLYAVSLADREHAFAVGGSLFFHTEDGGASWARQQTPPMTDLRGVQALDASTVIAVGDRGKILQTMDAGATWIERESGTTETLNGVAFADRKVGAIIGNRGTLLLTRDGGLTWTPQQTDIALSLQSVSFPSNRVGFIVGSGGETLRTTDGGETWTRQGLGRYLVLRAVSFFDETTGITVGNNGIVLTAGGVSSD